MPKSLGNWVLARTSATPHLNPTITLSEMKLTIEPARASHAMKAVSATRRAVPAGRGRQRVVSPPEKSPREAPTRSEMAEVTVMAVWRELQKIQKTMPEKRHA